MNIAHVVTFVSADNAFGGPISVARVQTEELARRGHRVTLLGGWDGVGQCEIAGVAVHLHRAHRVVPGAGFSGLAAPGLFRELRRLLPTLDVVHVHLGRDLVTLPAAKMASARPSGLVLQTHGMVMPDSRWIARLADAAATRATLTAARYVAVLTDIERDGVRRVARGTVRATQLRNGVELADRRRTGDRGQRPRVVFCARLHPRKRVLAFAEMAQLLLKSGREADFIVAGPDEGDHAALVGYLAAEGLSDRVRYVGALAPDRVRRFLADASVFVLPSDREPFPMTLLEAMAEGTPSVITSGCMIAPQLAGAGGPVVTDGSPAELAAAVARLLDDGNLAERAARRSQEMISTQYAIAGVVDQLEDLYTS